MKSNESELIKRCRSDWNYFAKKILGVSLDESQQEILTAVQNNRRISVRSGTSRGKDFVSAVAAMCFLYLHSPSKVILTAPTGRQVDLIMLPEIKKIWNDCIQRGVKLGGEISGRMIKFEGKPDRFLVGFKADDTESQNWQGFHSPNIMFVVTEASGIRDLIYDAIEGCLQGNSRLLIVGNPDNTQGEFYRSTKSNIYTKFKLSSLDAPNVLAKKEIYPGQVDWNWIDEKIKKGLAMPISAEEVDKSKHDFEWGEAWEKRWYRPSTWFRIKVLGEFPEESDSTLIPMSWIERSNLLHKEFSANVKSMTDLYAVHKLKLGVDIAGMGSDKTVFCHKYGNFVRSIKSLNIIKDDRIHMNVAGAIRNELHHGGVALLDTIGEGSGVFSRLRELGFNNAISCKFSESAKGLTDYTKIFKFKNMRAYCYWALRDALNPANGINLMLPESDELMQELNEIQYSMGSDFIEIEKKESIKKRIGRSPDFADCLANTFYPHIHHTNVVSKHSIGFY
jgi:hypothetical protein